ncbi:MAG: methyltransferase domain-containing protein [Deltaproteobacteria bacterium]|nr:methyltransferase domain-containing protein [Deltaproteobacteria bacterium]
MKSVANNFFDEWSVYDQVLDHNYMHHDNIYRDVQSFLADRYATQPFTLLDLGCGSARHLARALQGRSISRYVGYDLSDVALAHAKQNLAPLSCPVELRLGDLLEGLRASREKFDAVFTSFALHHLATAEKEMFFQSAYERLRKHGILLLIDTMREEGGDRPIYLDRYCAWLRSNCESRFPLRPYPRQRLSGNHCNAQCDGSSGGIRPGDGNIPNRLAPHLVLRSETGWLIR